MCSQIPDSPVRIDIGGIDINRIAGTGSLNIGETYNIRAQTGPTGKDSSGTRQKQADPPAKGRAT